MNRKNKKGFRLYCDWPEAIPTDRAGIGRWIDIVSTHYCWFEDPEILVGLLVGYKHGVDMDAEGNLALSINEV